MPLSFDQVKGAYNTLQETQPEKFGSMSLPDFADFANRTTGTNSFDVGKVGLLKRGVFEGNRLLNLGLEQSDVPTMAEHVGGDVGGALDRLFGRDDNFYGSRLSAIGHGLPRAGADIAMMATGLPGFVAGVGSGATSAYAESNDWREAAKSAALQAVLPATSKIGKTLFTSGAARLADRFAPELASKIYAGGTTTDILNKIGGFGGMYAGQMAGDMATNAAMGKGATDGLGAGEYALTQLAGALPFAGLELKKTPQEHMFVPTRGQATPPVTYAEALLQAAQVKQQKAATSPVTGTVGAQNNQPQLPIATSWNLTSQAPVLTKPSWVVTMKGGMTATFENVKDAQIFSSNNDGVKIDQVNRALQTPSQAFSMWTSGVSQMTPTELVQRTAPTTQTGGTTSTVYGQPKQNDTGAVSNAMPGAVEAQQPNAATEGNVSPAYIKSIKKSYDLSVKQGNPISAKWVDMGMPAPEGYERQGDQYVKTSGPTPAVFEVSTPEVPSEILAQAAVTDVTPTSLELAKQRVAEIKAKQQKTVDDLGQVTPPQSAEDVLTQGRALVDVATDNNITMQPDSARQNNVSAKLNAGDNINESMQKQTVADTNNVRLALKLKEVPDSVPDNVASIIETLENGTKNPDGSVKLPGFIDKAKAIANDTNATPEAKQRAAADLQREYDVLHRNLITHGEDPEKVAHIVSQYEQWNQAGRPGGPAGFANRVSNKLSDIKRKDANKEKTRAKKQGAQMVKDADLNNAVHDWMTAVDAGSEDAITARNLATRFVMRASESSKDIDTNKMLETVANWWASPVDKRGDLEAMLSKTFAVESIKKTEAGADEFLKDNGDWGTKGKTNQKFGSKESAQDFIDGQVPDKDKATYAFYPHKVDEQFYVKRRPRTKNVSLTAFDDDAAAAGRLNGEQFSHDPDAPLWEQLQYMYLGKKAGTRAGSPLLDNLSRKFGDAQKFAEANGLVENEKITEEALQDINQEMRKKFGWFLDPHSGKWMSELPDNNMRLNGDITLDMIGKSYRLGDLMSHDLLFNVYPGLKNLPIALESSMTGNEGGAWNAKDKSLHVRLLPSTFDAPASEIREKVLDTLTHEIQHGIQDFESQSRGSSPTTMGYIKALARDMLNPKHASGEELRSELQPMPDEVHKAVMDNMATLTQHDNFKLYWKSVGEMYARDSAMRRHLTAGRRLQDEPLSRGGRDYETGKLIQPDESLSFLDTPEDLIHPQTVLQRLLERDGRSPEVAATTAQTVDKVQQMLGQTKLQWHELRSLDPSDPRIGSFMSMSDGSRLIGLRMLGQDFTDGLSVGRVFHEMGHDYIEQYNNGQLAPEHVEAMKSLVDSIGSMSYTDKEAMLIHIHDELLPPNLRGNDLKTSITDPLNINDNSEVLANTIGMLSHIAANFKAPTVFEKIITFPITLMRGVRSFYRYLRDNFKTIRQAQFFQDFGNKLGINTPHETVDRFTIHLSSVVKRMTNMDSVLADQVRFDDLQHGGYSRMREEVEGNPLYLHQLDTATRPAAAFMTFKGMAKGLKENVDKILPPLQALAGDPRVKEVASLPNVESIEMHSKMRRFQNILHADNPDQTAGPMRMNKNSAVAQVLRDPMALKTYGDLQRYAQEKGDASVANGAAVGDTIFDLNAQGDKFVASQLGKLNPTQRSNVLEYFARAQKAQGLFAEDYKTDKTQIFRDVVSSALLTRGVVTSYPQAREIAEAALQEANTNRAAGQGNINQTLTQALAAHPELTNPLIGLVNGGLDVIDGSYKTMTQRPYFITEQRFGQYQVSYKQTTKVNGKDSTRTGLRDFDSPEEARQWMNEANKDATIKLLDKFPVDSYATHGGQGQNYTPLKEYLSRVELKSINQITGLLQQLGGTPEQIEMAKQLVSSTPDVEQYEQMSRVGTLATKRQFKPGREALDMGAQQTEMAARMARMLTRQKSDAALMAMKNDTGIFNESTKHLTDLAEQTMQNYRQGDSRSMRFVQTAGYLWYTATNISNAVLNQSSFVVSLIPQLVEEGSSLVRAHSLVGGAAKRMLERGLGNALPPEYERLLNRAEAGGRVGFWDPNQVADNEAQAGDPDRPGLFSGVPRALLQVASLPFRLGTHYNDSVSLIAAYDLMKGKMFVDKALSDKEFGQVFNEATRIAGMTTANFGKVNRPTALFSGSNNLWKTTAAMVYNLQAFSAGLYANVLRQAHKGFGESLKGILSPQERTQAQKAFGVSMLSLTSLAGLAGVPMLLPIVKLWEQATGQDVETALQETVKSLGDHFGGAPVGDFFSQVAQHGLLHAAGLPVDISQRVAPGGLFGFNSYNGFEPSKMFGATPGIASNLFSSLQAAEQGDWSKAFEKGLPPSLGKLLSLTHAPIQDSQGNLVIRDPSWGQKAAFALGFTPREAVVKNDAAQLVKRVNATAKLDDERLANVGADALRSGDQSTVMKLLADERQRRGTTFDPSKGLEAMLNKLEERTFGTDVRDQTTTHGSDIFDRLQGKVVPPQQGSVMERLMWRNQLHQSIMGQPYSNDRFERAMGIDAMRSSHPDLSTVRAASVMDQLSRRTVSSSPFQRSPLEMMSGVQ